MNEEVYIQIEAYLGDSMTAEEAQSFEAKIAADPVLATEVSLYDSINHHLREESWKPLDQTSESKEQKALETYFRSEEASQVEDALRQVQQKYTATTAKPSNSFPFFRYVAAAVVALLIVGASYLAFQPKSYDALYVEYYTAKELPSLVTRGASEKALSNGVIAFQQKDFRAALEAFDTYVQTNKKVNPLVYSYIGMSHLELGAPEQAISAFDQLLNSDSIDRSKALWYQSVVYLKIKQKEKLQETLKQIIADPGNFNYEKAKRLLKDL